MQDDHVLAGQLHLLGVQYVAVLKADVVLFVEEAFLLYAGHVQDVGLTDCIFQPFHLDVLDARRFQNVLGNVLRYLQLLGADEDEAVALVAAHRLCERVDGAAEFEVAAEAYLVVLEASAQHPDCHQVGQGLRGVVVAAVARVDDGDRAVLGGEQGRPLLGAPHRNDVDVGADDADRVGKRLALGHGGVARIGKAFHRAAQVQHGRLERQAGPGARLIKKCRKDFPAAHILKRDRVNYDFLCERANLLNLADAQVARLYDVPSFQNPHFTPSLQSEVSSIII